MGCELCGRDSELYETAIEGTRLNLCKDCSSFGNIVKKVEDKKDLATEAKHEVGKEIFKEEKEIVDDDCANIVKTAREKKRITQEELARAIAEKESIIHKIESGQITPQMKTAKKLEQFLRIKLITSYDGRNSGIKLNFNDETMTIGDLIKIKSKEKNG